VAVSAEPTVQEILDGARVRANAARQYSLAAAAKGNVLRRNADDACDRAFARDIRSIRARQSFVARNAGRVSGAPTRS
jgi:hypothetical protein